MKPRKHIIVWISLFCLLGIAGFAGASPQFTPEHPFASDGFGEKSEEKLVVVCGTPPEFEMTQPVLPSTPKPNALSVPLSDEHGSSENLAIPEPSTLLLLGVGLLGLFQLARKNRR